MVVPEAEIELDLRNLKGRMFGLIPFFHYFSFMLDLVRASTTFGSLLAKVSLLLHSSLGSFFVLHTVSLPMCFSLSVKILPSLFQLL